MHDRRIGSLFIFLSIICLLRPVAVFSNSNVDSLQALIESAPDSNKANLLYDLARIFQKASSYEKAIASCSDAVAISIKLKNESSEAAGYLNLGSICRAKSDFDRSLQYYLKALAIYERLNLLGKIAGAKNNIGNLYMNLRNYDKALQYLKESLEIRQRGNSPDEIAQAMLNIGGVYYQVNDYDNCLKYYYMALVIYKNINNKSQVAVNENNIGAVLTEVNKIDSALAHFNASLVLYNELKDSSGMALSLVNIGNAFIQSGQYKKGIEYSTRALDIALKTNDKDIQAGAYEYLFEGYSKSGDLKRALAYQTALMDLKDTIYDLQSNQNIAEMQTKYDSEKKEHENELLKQTVQIQELDANRKNIIIYSVSLLSVLLVTLAFFVYRGYRQKQRANTALAEKSLIIEEKSKIVEEKNKDITDSIRYARRLQQAILKPEEGICSLFPESFILFRPKDIVSGDFYWFEKFGNLTMVAAADCTGHGVPGAFMSIIGCNLMSQAVNEYALTKPSVILNSLNKGLSKILHQRMDESSVADGMDIALCAFDLQKMTLEYAGAYNPMWIIRNGELMEFQGDKFPIGAFLGEQLKVFNNREVALKKGDTIYLFSDGFADQFGGPKGKKFKYKQMLELIIGMQDKPMKEQREVMNTAFEDWKANLEQVDDVLVVGVRV
jgi:serine phosphatase RsbU (regulator of sigma subunit)